MWLPLHELLRTRKTGRMEARGLEKKELINFLKAWIINGFFQKENCTLDYFQRLSLASNNLIGWFGSLKNFCIAYKNNLISLFLKSLTITVVKGDFDVKKHSCSIGKEWFVISSNGGPDTYDLSFELKIIQSSQCLLGEKTFLFAKVIHLSLIGFSLQARLVLVD